MRYLVNALAQHEVHVARYYMKRTAYVAAANRAQYAIQHYPQAPAVEEAKAILKNFPDSVYLKAGGGKKGAPWWRLWDPEW